MPVHDGIHEGREALAVPGLHPRPSPHQQLNQTSVPALNVQYHKMVISLECYCRIVRNEPINPSFYSVSKVQSHDVVE